MSRVVEKAHNSKTTEALLVRQHLEKASVEAIDSMKDEIQGARTSADMWWVEKRITVQVSHERAKAYCALAQHHDSVSDNLTGKGGYRVIQDSRSRGELPQIYQQLSFHSRYWGCQSSWGMRGSIDLQCSLPGVNSTSGSSANTDYWPATREGVQDNSGWCLTEHFHGSKHCKFPPQFTFNRGSKCPHGGWEIHH